MSVINVPVGKGTILRLCKTIVQSVAADLKMDAEIECNAHF